ncbi:MAG: DEAD/DEAH box helicase [Candidatus Dormibacteria bacterium]|jgi:ATP-dependent RNA helicase RhlE
MTSFAELGVRTRTLESLGRLGITEPNAVQREALPGLLGGGDAVIEAPTGSGKTLAFAIPVVERLRGHRPGGPRALVVGPTRELCQQVASVIAALDRELHVAVLYGGVGYGAQWHALSSGADIVVGCPGRILDLISVQRRASFARVEYLVLDEGDEMLDSGFAHDVESIIALCPDRSRRQTILASATMPDWVERMIDRHLRAPLRVRVAQEAAPDLEHGILGVADELRLEALVTLLRQQPAGAGTIVFTRTKHGAKKLTRKLEGLSLRVVELQGNLSQNARDRSIASFREGEADVLVATNVAARGLDVPRVSLVVNYELPESALWLTHRIGRTARNGACGRAVTLLSATDADQWHKLQRGGAPHLRRLHSEPLLQRGEWLYLTEAEALAATPAPVRGGSPGRPRYPAGSFRPRRQAPRRSAA